LSPSSKKCPSLNSRVMAIDPASYRTGWAFYGVEGLVYGEISVKGKEFSSRLQQFYLEWSNLLDQYSPDVVASEDQFFKSNAKTLKMLAMVRGVAMLAATLRGAEFKLYAPMEIKKIMTGDGRAGKPEMIAAAKKRFEIAADITDNEADALSILYTTTLKEGSWPLTLTN
jgi:crossover junction endodeoxyribonuclease RuvC